jgi:hypothetical protein
MGIRNKLSTFLATALFRDGAHFGFTLHETGRAVWRCGLNWGSICDGAVFCDGSFV